MQLKMSLPRLPSIAFDCTLREDPSEPDKVGQRSGIPFACDNKSIAMGTEELYVAVTNLVFVLFSHIENLKV